MSTPRKTGRKPASPKAAEEVVAESPEGEAPRKAFVQSLERGLSVLTAFDAEHPTLTLSDVARLTGLDRAAARRFLYTFVDLGYMRVDGRSFSLRPKLLELGYAYLSSLRLPEISAPHLRKLADEVHESSYVSIMENNENVCVAHVPIRRIWTATITVGTRLPLLGTASGRTLVAWLDPQTIQALLVKCKLPQITRFTKSNSKELEAELVRVRKQGWAYVDQALEEGLRVVAVPVRDPNGKVIASISVSTLASSASRDDILHNMLPPVQHAAAMIEADYAPLVR